MNFKANLTMTDLEILSAVAECIAAHNVALRSFVARLIDPDDLGHAVTPEVRQKASIVLSMQNVCPPCNNQCRQGRDCPARNT